MTGSDSSVEITKPEGRTLQAVRPWVSVPKMAPDIGDAKASKRRFWPESGFLSEKSAFSGKIWRFPYQESVFRDTERRSPISERRSVIAEGVPLSGIGVRLIGVGRFLTGDWRLVSRNRGPLLPADNPEGGADFSFSPQRLPTL